MRGRLPLCLVAVALLAGCTQVDGSPVTQVVQRQRPVPVPQPVELRTASERGSPGVVAAGGLPATSSPLPVPWRCRCQSVSVPVTRPWWIS